MPLPPLDLSEHIARALEESGVPAGAPLVAAVSGGCDSMALLTGLIRRPELRARLAVGHVDHGLRPEAQEECDFVRRACAETEVPFHTTRLSVDPAGPGNLADRLRNARYAFLERLVPPDGYLLTAHHADDQGVTLLMRLIEGAGLPGLAGIPRRRNHIVRPLLDVPRRELQAWLRHHGIAWCVDASNESEASFRNRVRQRIWRPLVEEQPDAPALVAAVARSLREDDEALQQWARGVLQDARAGYHWVEVDLPPAGLPPAVLRRVIQAVLDVKWATRPLSSMQWATVRSRLATGRRLNLSGRVTVHNVANVLVFEHETLPPDWGIRVDAPGTFSVPTGMLKVQGADFPLWVRSWRAGDRIDSGKRVADWLAAHGIARHRRPGWPVLTPASDESIVRAVALPTTDPSSAQADYVLKDVLKSPFQG